MTTNSTNSTRFFISSVATSLENELGGFVSTASVEAEFGDSCVYGSVRTLAHHGSRAGNPCPCLHENEVALELDAVGLSHVDLDALGGVMALLGLKPEFPGFWALAAHVDLNGPHRIPSDACASDVRALHAWWAWGEAHRVFAPRDGTVLDITSHVWECVEVITRILAGDDELLALGDMWVRAHTGLETDSYRESFGFDGVLLREHTQFVNHLYSHGGVVFRGVVSYNPEKGTITLSLEDPKTHPYVSCAAIARELWGDQAGGHPGIAGSPRAGGLTLEDARRAARRLYEAVFI